MSIKLSQIATGGALAPATDQIVTVRSGNTDVLTTPGTAAAKAATDNTKATVASVSGTINTNHVAQFADAAGTVKDGGVLGTSAAQAASSVTGTVAAVSGGVTSGHIAVFSDTAGTIQDGGVNTTGTVTTVSVVSANGLAGTVATATTTPAITLTTSITGLLKGNGTAISAASAGTDYVAPATTVNGHPLSANVTVSATDITTGTLPAAQLPNPSASTLGGVQSKAAVTSNFLTSISTSGVPAAAQPAFTDISGTAAAAQLPLATTSAFGAVKPDGTTITISAGIISAASSGPAYVASSGTATAGGSAALAAGPTSSAAGNSSVALGDSAVASGLVDIVIGSSATTAGNTGGTRNVVLGFGSGVSGGATGVDRCVILGASAGSDQNNTVYGVAIGGGANIRGTDPIAIGKNAQTTGNSGVAIGDGTLCTHNGATIVGSGLASSAANDAKFGNTTNFLNINGTDGAGASVGTLTNAPHAGNPDAWIPVTRNGVAGWWPWWHA